MVKCADNMNSFFSFILDALFPPSKETLELRTLEPAHLALRLPVAPPSPFPFISSVFAYKDPLVAEMISAIKNKRDRHAFRLAGHALFGKLHDKALLVPIPLSKKKRRERGYNQSELLIDEIIKLDSENRFQKNTEILKRVKHTEEQKLKTRQERLGNKNIFSVTYVPIDLPIILIDDVTTTGSTLKEAHEVLLSTGYTDVRALTLAH